MSLGGRPSTRIRNVRGIAICPRMADLATRGEPPVAGNVVRPCLVCFEPCSTAPSTRHMTERHGYAVVCSHDAWRFKHLLTDDEIRGSVEAFARRHGADPSEIERVLPPELAWLEARL